MPALALAPSISLRSVAAVAVVGLQVEFRNAMHQIPSFEIKII